jgi:hypothetical protein
MGFSVWTGSGNSHISVEEPRAKVIVFRLGLFRDRLELVWIFFRMTSSSVPSDKAPVVFRNPFCHREQNGEFSSIAIWRHKPRWSKRIRGDKRHLFLQEVTVFRTSSVFVRGVRALWGIVCSIGFRPYCHCSRVWCRGINALLIKRRRCLCFLREWNRHASIDNGKTSALRVIYTSISSVSREVLSLGFDFFSAPPHPSRLRVASSLLANGYRCPFQWIKWPKRETDHSTQSSVEVQNTWRYSSTPPYVFMAWYLAQGQLLCATFHFTGRTKAIQSCPLLAGMCQSSIKPSRTMCFYGFVHIVNFWISFLCNIQLLCQIFTGRSC